MSKRDLARSGLDLHLKAIWPADLHTLDLRRRPWFGPHGSAYALLPRVSRPALLLPVSPAAVTAAALGDYGSAATASARRRTAVLSRLARMGVARLIPASLVVVPRTGAQSLISHVCAELGQELVASVQLGPPRANRKPVITLFTCDGTVVAYTKVGVNALTKARVRAEAEALHRLGQADLGTLVAPHVLASGSWRGSEYMTLAPLVTSSGRDIVPEQREAAARDLAAAFPQQQLELVQSPWWHALRSRVEALKGDESAALSELTARVEVAAAGRVISLGAQHGDWTPWNLQTVGAATNVWDWERFATDVPIGLDQLHYTFHEATAVVGTSPSVALAQLRAMASTVLSAHGIDREMANLLYLVYLSSTGERFLSDRQEAAGSQKGPLTSWLLPALRDALGGVI